MKRFLLMFISLMLTSATIWAVPADVPLKDDGTKYKIFIQDVRLVGIDEQYTAIYSAFIASAIRELNLFEVVTSKDLAELIDYDNLKDVMDCDSVSCLAQIGGVAIADYMVTSNISKFSDSFALSLTLSDVTTLKQLNMVTGILKGDSPMQLNLFLPLEAKSLFAKYLSAGEQQQLAAEIASMTAGNSPEKTVAKIKTEPVKGPVDSKLSALKKGSIATGVIGGIVTITGGILFGVGESSLDHLYGMKLSVNEEEDEERRIYPTVESGISLMVFGGAFIATSIILGSTYAVKKKQARLTFMPSVTSEGAHFSLAYRW